MDDTTQQQLDALLQCTRVCHEMWLIRVLFNINCHVKLKQGILLKRTIKSVFLLYRGNYCWLLVQKSEIV